MSAYREGLESGDFDLVVRRNIFRDDEAPIASVTFVAERLRDVAAEIDAVPLDDMLRGRIA